MAENNQNQLYQQLLNMQKPQPMVAPTSRTTVGPSQKTQLSYRDYVIKSLQETPSLTDQINRIASGEQSKPLGAFGNLGKFAVQNPISKTILGGLSAIDVPRRVVISGIKELKDALDSNPDTKASFSEYKSQVADPTFGFGRVMPMGGWGGRIVGLFGDLVFDPINWATFGGAILKKSVTKTGQIAALAAEKELAKSGFNIMNMTAREMQLVGATSKGARTATTPTREFLGGVKRLGGRTGNEALASGAAKLGATEIQVGEILARGRNAVPDNIVELMGLNDYGIYYFGSRVKVPFSGLLGQGLASGLTKARLGILSTKPGEYLARMATANGTAGGMSLRDIRFAGRAGKPMPDGLTPRMGLAILDGEKAMRAAKGIAARDAAKIIGDALNNPDVKAESGVLYKLLDPVAEPANLTERQARAMAVIKNATDQLFANIKSYGIQVADGDANGFQIANWRARYFPHKLTKEAQKFLESTTSKRVEDIRQYFKIDHTNIGGSFESRNLERLVKSGKKDVDWFGTMLTEKHVDEGIDTLNELARKGGFKGNFFETDANRALTSYLENYTEGIGTIAFYQSLKQSGSDIGGMAVKRGMITKEALDGLVGETQQAHNLLLATFNNVKTQAKNYVDGVLKEANVELKTQTKVANVTSDELVGILDQGLKDAKVLGGQQADAATQKIALDNLTKARETFALQRAAVIKNHLTLVGKFEKASFLADELTGQHDELVHALDLIDKRLQLYGDSIIQNANTAESKIALTKDLKILNESIDSAHAEVKASIDALGQHTDEFLNDAIGGIVDYALGMGKNASSIVTNLNDLSRYGKILTGPNRKQASRGILKGLGEDNISRLLNAQKMAVPVGTVAEQAQYNAWVDLKDLLKLNEVTRKTLIEFDRDKVLNILVRASSSSDPNDIGAVRDAISWLFVRSQLDNPNFAKELLDNPTRDFETIKVLLKSAEVRERFALNYTNVATDELGNILIKNIGDLPPELRNSARVIQLINQITDLETKLGQVSEHLGRVPDMNYGVIAASIDDIVGDAIQPDTVLNPKMLDYIITHLKNVDSTVDHQTGTQLTEYISMLEKVTSSANYQVTYGEFTQDVAERFGGPNLRGGNVSRVSRQDFRLTKAERELYPSPNEFEEYRPRILRAQRETSTGLEAAREELKVTTRKLTNAEQDEMAIVMGSNLSYFSSLSPVRQAGGVGGDMPSYARGLAQATANLYLDREAAYVLRAANEELSVVGKSLTPQGHAQLMNLTHVKFATEANSHLVKLNKAQGLMRDLADNVMNSGKFGIDLKLELMSRLKVLLDDPETGPLITELFPGIAMHMRVKNLAPEAIVLAGNKQYQLELNILADTELRWFGVPETQGPGGAGVIDFANADNLNVAATQALESSRRLQSSTLGSQGLQKQGILDRLYNKKHSSTKTYIENLKTKLNQSKTLTKDQKANARYELDLIQGRVDEIHAKVSTDRKTAKELSARSGGPKSGTGDVRKMQEEAARKARGKSKKVADFDPNSIERYLARALNSFNTSPRPIKEFFGQLLGGEDFRVPTLRGSEAQRLSGESMSFASIKAEDSYFGRNIAASTEIRDMSSKRLYSTNPTEAQEMLQKADYLKSLQDNLIRLEQTIQDRPEAMRLLSIANKELDKAEKAAGGVWNAETKQWTGGLNYDQRVAYLDQLATISGESAPGQRVFDPVTGEWTMKRAKGVTRKDISGLTKEQQGPPLPSKQMSQVADDIIPEQLFTPREVQLIKDYKVASIQYDRFVSQPEYGFAQRAQSIYNFKQELTGVDLTKVNWTISGDTGNAVNWNQGLVNNINRKVTEQHNQAFSLDDAIIQAPAEMFTKNMASLQNPFDSKNINTVIARMADVNRPPLIFVGANGAEIQLRVGRQLDGTPLGYLEKATINYDVALKAERGVPIDTKDYVKWEPWAPTSEQVRIIEPRDIAVDGTNVRQAKRMLLSDVGGDGTVFDPETVWIRHNPERLASGDALIGEQLNNPPYYKKISNYVNTGRGPEPILNWDGAPMAFTEFEQEALHSNFEDKIYNIFRNPNKQLWAKEVRRLEAVVETKSKAIVEIQRTISESTRGRLVSDPAIMVKGTQKRLLTVFKSDIDEAQQQIDALYRAAKIWDSRVSANQKVAHLYNSFNKGEYGAYTNINTGSMQPNNAIKHWLQTQTSPDRPTSILVSDELKSSRKAIADKSWNASNDADIIRQAQELNKNVQIKIHTWGDEDANVVKNIIRAKAKLRNVGEMNGLTADAQRRALQEELERKGVTFGQQEAPVNIIDNPVEQVPTGSEIPSISRATTYGPTSVVKPATLPQLRKGVNTVGDEITADLETGPFVQNIGQSRDELLSANRQLQTDVNLGEDATQAAAMQADLDWMNYTRKTVVEAGKEDLQQQATLVGKRNKLVNEAGTGKLDVANRTVAKLQQELGPDPYLSSPLTRRARDLGLIPNPMPAQEQVLQTAQRAFDASSVQHTGADIAVAFEKIDTIQKIIALGQKARASLKTLKNVKDYPAFATEFDIFHEEATKFLGLISNPVIDKNIRDQGIKWVEANVEYFKQIASMSEAERVSKTLAGLGKASYYNKAGEMQEGKLVTDPALLPKGLDGSAVWLTHFDDGMVRLGKQFPNIQVAAPIAEFVQNVHRLQEPAIAMELNRFLGEYTKFFKAYATLSPGFHIRNSISNGFMLFAAGGNPKYLLEGLQMSRSLNEASKSGKSVEEWIMSLPAKKQAQARIGVRASAASGGGNASDNLRQLYMSGRMVNNPLTRGSKKLGQWIEGHSRFMLAYDGAMQGMDFNTAAARVQRFLIDYEDVSTLDKTMRQIVPFWMWTSRNLPMQVQNIWLNPRAYQIYGTVKRNFTAEESPQDVVPVWMREMGAFKLPFGQNLYATPDIGFNRIQSDVNMLQDPSRFLSNLNPLLRLPIELTGEKQFFSNKRFSKTPVEVEGGLSSVIQPLMEMLGYGETGANGKKFVNDKAFYALRNLLPMLSRSESLNPSITTLQGGNQSNPLYSLLGLPIKENTQKMQDSELMRRLYETQGLIQNNRATNGTP